MPASVFGMSMGIVNGRDPSRPPEDGRCLLDAIPPELRNLIFEFAVVEPAPIKLTVSRYSTYIGRWEAYDTAIKITRNQFSNQVPGLSLASTCRQFREEVIEVFYAQNIFSLELAKFTVRSDKTTLKFPLHKANSVVFKKLKEKGRDAWTGATVFVEPKLHVEKQPDNTLSIRADDWRVGFCLCRFIDLAGESSGVDCLPTFVHCFVERDLWDKVDQDPYSSGYSHTCTRCGKAQV